MNNTTVYFIIFFNFVVVPISHIMNVALVLTVKNEERLLRSNLLYHHAIGACEIFVYFDNTTDTGKKSISDLDFVTLQDSVPHMAYDSIKFLDTFTSNAQEHHTARQCLNTYHALQQCKEKKYDWLISIDADELVCTDTSNPSNLSSFFSEIPPAIDVVNLSVLEALQQRAAYKNVFVEETMFKTTHSYGNRFRNILKSFDNPFINTSQKFSYWYGQHAGKGCIRVASNVIPRNVHKYVLQDGVQPVVYNAGHVLHYHAYDSQDFVKKFTNFSTHPDTFLSGQKVNSLKLLLRDVVNTSGMNQEQLKIYFEENIMFSEKEVQQLKQNKYLGILSRNPAPLREITSVNMVFTSKIKAS